MNNENKLNEKGLIREVARDANLKINKATIFLESFKNVVTNNLKKNKSVHLIGFGLFETFIRHERKGVNPWLTSHPGIILPPIRIAKFRTGYHLKKALKGSATPDTNSANNQQKKDYPED